MLVVKVELHSAVTKEVTEIARSVIWNEGGSFQHGPGRYSYRCHVVRGQTPANFDENMQRQVWKESGWVHGYARSREHVFNLVSLALLAMGFGFTETNKGVEIRRDLKEFERRALDGTPTEQ